jgi:hypothetical protein
LVVDISSDEEEDTPPAQEHEKPEAQKDDL